VSPETTFARASIHIVLPHSLLRVHCFLAST
jgi:hypothetical protein